MAQILAEETRKKLARFCTLSENIKKSVRSNMMPEKSDFKACKGIICDISNETCNEDFLPEFASNVYDLLDAMQTMSSQLMDANKKLEKQVQELEEIIKQLREKVEALEKKHSNDILILGQLPFSIEALIIKWVLKNVHGEKKGFPCIFKIREMEEALNSPVDGMLFHDEKEQAAARGEWEELKRRLGWERYDVNILQHLKRHRLSTAHPEITPDIVRESLGKLSKLKKSDTDFQNDVMSFEKFLTIYETLHYLETHSHTEHRVHMCS